MQGPSMMDKAKATAAGAATSVQETAYNLKDRVMGPSSGTSTGTSTGTQVRRWAHSNACTWGQAVCGVWYAFGLLGQSGCEKRGPAMQGPSMLDKAKATAAGAATSVQDTAYGLKDRAMGTFAPAQVRHPAQTPHLCEPQKAVCRPCVTEVGKDCPLLSSIHIFKRDVK